jgi:hypothetical protein
MARITAMNSGQTFIEVGIVSTAGYFMDFAQNCNHMFQNFCCHYNLLVPITPRQKPRHHTNMNYLPRQHTQIPNEVHMAAAYPHSLHAERQTEPMAEEGGSATSPILREKDDGNKSNQ